MPRANMQQLRPVPNVPPLRSVQDVIGDTRFHRFQRCARSRPPRVRPFIIGIGQFQRFKTFQSFHRFAPFKSLSGRKCRNCGDMAWSDPVTEQPCYNALTTPHIMAFPQSFLFLFCECPVLFFLHLLSHLVSRAWFSSFPF
jgi:hypothetical protein